MLTEALTHPGSSSAAASVRAAFSSSMFFGSGLDVTLVAFATAGASVGATASATFVPSSPPGEQKTQRRQLDYERASSTRIEPDRPVPKQVHSNDHRHSCHTMRNAEGSDGQNLVSRTRDLMCTTMSVVAHAANKRQHERLRLQQASQPVARGTYLQQCRSARPARSLPAPASVVVTRRSRHDCGLRNVVFAPRERRGKIIIIFPTLEIVISVFDSFGVREK